MAPDNPKPVRKHSGPRQLVQPDGNPLNNAPYRDVNGKYRTTSLFLETINFELGDHYQPRFTLKEHDFYPAPSNKYYDAYPNHVIPSLRRLYLEVSDPEEFLFAMEVFKSDRHWQILTDAEWFQPYLHEYREALHKKLRSEAIRDIRKISGSMDEAKALQAAKWLGEGGYKAKREKGRPEASEVVRETKVQVASKAMVNEDAERIGLILTPTTQTEGQG